MPEFGENSDSNANELRQRKLTDSEDKKDGPGVSDNISTNGVNKEGIPSCSPLQPPLYHNYGSGKAYADAVRTWMWAYHSWQFTQFMAPILFQQTLLNTHLQQTNNQNQLGRTTSFSSSTNQAETNQPRSRTTPTSPSATHIPSNGSQHIIATYGRRLISELIDFSFCFVLKLLIVYLMVEFSFIDIDKYERLLGDTADLKTFIDITQDLFPVEIANKFVTSILEALYITYGWGPVHPGFTPGKYVMGLKVIHCEKVYSLAPRDYRVIVEGEKPVPLIQSMVRSFIKNFALSFLFPLCVTMYAFRFNRSLYDIASNTLVVEAPRRQ